MKLDAYLQLIGFTEKLACDLPKLRAVVFAHATSIPFECLDPLSGIPVSLDITAIEDKLVPQLKTATTPERVVAQLLFFSPRFPARSVVDLAAAILSGGRYRSSERDARMSYCSSR